MELQNHGIPIPQSHIAGPSHASAIQGPPPTLGHGPNNAFSGIITNPGGGGAPGLAPPPPPPQDQAQPSQHPLQQPAPGAQVPPQPQEAGYVYPNGKLRSSYF